MNSCSLKRRNTNRTKITSVVLGTWRLQTWLFLTFFSIKLFWYVMVDSTSAFIFQRRLHSVYPRTGRSKQDIALAIRTILTKALELVHKYRRGEWSNDVHFLICRLQHQNRGGYVKISSTCLKCKDNKVLGQCMQTKKIRNQSLDVLIPYYLKFLVARSQYPGEDENGI